MAIKISFILVVLTILVCLSTQFVEEDDTPYQCSSSFTFSESKYDISYDSGSINSLQERKSIQTSTQLVNGKIRQLQLIFYLVRASASAPQNTIRVKIVQTDGTILQLPDLVVNGAVQFFEAKSAYGVAITNNAMYYLKFLYTGITHQFINIIHETSNSQFLIYTEWTPISLVHADGTHNFILFRENASPDLYVFVYYTQGVEGWFEQYFAFPSSEADIQASANYIMYDSVSNKIYRLGTERALVTTYGNQRLFSMYTTYSGLQSSSVDIATPYVYMFSAIWSHNPSTNTTYFHIIYASISDVALLHTISTPLFTDLSKIQLYFSTYNQHVIEYDGQHLRFSAVLNDLRQYYGYTTTLGDSIQLLVKDNAALQFDFIQTKIVILTDDAQIHIVVLVDGYRNGQSQLSNAVVDGGYYIRQNLVLNSQIKVDKTINLGEDLDYWIVSQYSDIIITKTHCTCIEQTIPKLKCFTNSICLWITNYKLFDCSEIDNFYVTPS